MRDDRRDRERGKGAWRAREKGGTRGRGKAGMGVKIDKEEGKRARAGER